MRRPAVTISPLVVQICQHYEVGAGFAAAYLRYLDAQADSLYDLAALPEPIPAWFDYAMNTNRRGTAWVNWLLPHLPSGAHRCLDLECGMGGLIVALTKRGFRAFGFVSSDEIASLARANCRDHGLLASVFTGNPLTGDLIEDEYQFDLITMLDGAAAAANAHQLIAFAAARLRPSGLLVFNAPNPNSIAHFNASARLHPLGYYVQLCAHYGGTCEAHNSPTSYLHPVRDIDALLSQNGADAHSAAFGSVWHEAQRRSSLIDRLSRDYLDLPPDQFAERYLRASWTLIARFA
jgi:2-polyprenyl-3-methyl-5-hydroxy-6-metoxy-1,4-benzoquinol methylase